MIGLDVKLLREFLGMTREDFAQRLECSPALVYKIETGDRAISPIFRKGLARLIRSRDFRGVETRLAKIKAELEEVAP